MYSPEKMADLNGLRCVVYRNVLQEFSFVLQNMTEVEGDEQLELTAQAKVSVNHIPNISTPPEQIAQCIC